MYKFLTIKGSCGQPYDINRCETAANNMLKQGYELVQVYQTILDGCLWKSSILVMVFKKIEQKEGEWEGDTTAIDSPPLRHPG